MSSLKLILVDDHQLLLEGVASMLQNIDYVKIIAKASSGEEAINLAGELQPDIILMDIMMQGMNGIEATRWIKEQNSLVKIILLSSEVTEEYVTTAVKAGVDGYLPKNANKNMLLQALNTVKSGDKYFSQTITNIILESFYKQQSNKESKVSGRSDLTQREKEVLEHVAEGKSNQEVADDLFISVKTVETHKTNILSKLGLRNTAELVKYAIKNKFIEI